MSLILSGTDGLSDVDGTAATPAVRGTDTNTGLFFPAADTVAASVGGTEGLRLTTTGLGVGTSSPSFLLHASTSSAAGTVTSGVRNTAADGNTRFALGNNAGTARATISLNNNSDEKMTIGPEGSFPMLFQTNGSERMRLDSSGNLGLGVTPSAWATLGPVIQMGSYGAYIAAQSGSEIVRVGSNNYYNAGFKYVTNGYASFYSQSVGQHLWYTAPSGTAGNAISFTQVLAIEGGKSLALENATSQTGTGITFPATQSASSNANTLDDYEEGTFTPTITGTTSGTVTTGSLLGTYTKIGNMVTVWVTIINPNATTIVGNWKIALPFTISMPNVSEYTGGTVTYTRNIPWNGGATYLSAWSTTGNAFTYLAWSYNNNPTTESYLVSGNLQASTLLSFTMSYRTS